MTIITNKLSKTPMKPSTIKAMLESESPPSATGVSAVVTLLNMDTSIVDMASVILLHSKRLPLEVRSATLAMKPYPI